MSEDYFIGYGRSTGGSLCVGRLPGRKSYCLYEIGGERHNVIRTLAFFKSEEAAVTAGEYIAFISKSMPVRDDR